MTTQLHTLTFDAHDPATLARFWATLLQRPLADDGITLPATEQPGFDIRFQHYPADETRHDQLHFDLTSDTPDAQQHTVERALALGATHCDVGQGPDADHVVLADPEGNPFCVIPHGNKFLADTARIGALSSDGTQAVGYFWAKALNWPLVWDQDEETAIQHPDGGSKISWGGPPVETKTGKNRHHLDLHGTPADLQRLTALGATILNDTEAGHTVLADPDGNEFCLYTR